MLWDAFETVVLPRRVNRQLRLTGLFYHASWPPFAAGAALFKSVNRREGFLSLFAARRRDNWQTSAWDKTSAAWME